MPYPFPLAASAGEARLPGTASQPAARAETTPSGREILSDFRPRSALQRPMAPPPPRPLSWSYAGSADTLSDDDAGQPAAATAASQSDSSAGPTNQESASPPAAPATAARVLPPAPPPLALRGTAAISRQTGGQTLASLGSGHAAPSPAAAAPRELNPAQADGEAGLAPTSPLPVAPATQPQQPSPAGPTVIIPIRMVPPSTGTGATLEVAGATVVLPPGVSLQQALGLKLPAAESSGTAAAEPAGRPVVIRLGDAAGADITAAVNAARLVGASDSLTLADGASAPQTAPGGSEQLARLCGASGSSLLAGGSAAGSIPVNGGRLFWIGTAGQSVGDSAWGEDEDGSETAAAGNRNDTIVFWFTPDSADANGPGDSGDWISDLSALGDAADRITDADACGDPSGGSGSDPLLATMVDGLSAAAASGGGLFLAVHDPAAGSAGGQALFVQINSLADLASLAVPTAGDPLA